MKKHPILTVLAILAGVIIFLGVLMTAVQEYSGRSTGIPFSNKIGVIPITGVIRDSGEILNQLVTFKKDRGIKSKYVILKQSLSYRGNKNRRVDRYDEEKMQEITQVLSMVISRDDGDYLNSRCKSCEDRDL